MALVNNVRQMQQKGMSNDEIFQTLTDKGASPNEIKKAMDQAQIKQAVSPNQEQQVPSQAPQQEQQTQQQAPQQGDENVEAPDQGDQYIPETPQTYPQEEGQNYEQYQPYSQQTQAPNTDTMSDIAEQIAEEKVNPTRKAITDLKNINERVQKKVEELDKRLKKIEDSIDELKKSIIGKVGSYGRSIEDMKEEMDMMQDSFSKALPNMIEKEKKSKSKKKKSSKKSKNKGKRDGGMESYLVR